MTEPTTTGISRRTLAKGAAWAVPAVAVAAAAPVRAQSGCEYELVLSDATCKVAGGEFNYKLVFALVGTTTGCTDPCTATITRVWQNTGQGETYWTGSASPGDVITVCDAPNMSNFLRVDAVIPCIPLPPEGYYLVSTPNFNSANNQCDVAPDCGSNLQRVSTQEVTPEEQAVADQAAAEQAAADQAAAEQAAAEKAAAEKAAAEKAAAEQAAADQAAAEQAAADQAAAEKAAAEQAAADQAAAEKAAADQAAAEKVAADQATASPSPTPES